MDHNIFEIAANKAKKPQKNRSDANRPAPDSKIDKVPTVSSSINNPIGDPEVVDMLARIEEMKHDLESQLREVRLKGEEKNFDVDRYLEKTANFKPQDVEDNIQKQRDFKDKVNKLIRPEACIQKLKKSQETLTRERKSKLIGSRKKNWIPAP